MSAPFVPLLPGVTSMPNLATPTRLKPIPVAAPAAFEPATPATLKPEPPAPAPAPHIVHGPPKITLERQSDLITHIRIECSCGQVTELKCEY
jgi:hypothetical protein